jgi:endonuclease YncB( thermonuclease family)
VTIARLARTAVRTAGCGLLALVWALSAGAHGAAAEDPVSTASRHGCPLAVSSTGTVAAVEDAATLRLADGRRLKLAGIHAPRGAEDGATAALSGWVGREVEIAAIAPSDRYGRVVAHVFSRNGTEWLQFLLVGGGDVIVLPQLSEDPCLAPLLRRETEARARKAGVWSGLLRIRQADDPRLADAIGTVGLVEGRVVSVGKTRSNTYLNFGTDWALDFTVMIPVSDFASGDDNLQPNRLVGRRVRVRGILEEWNGVLMRVRTPAQIERLDGRN